MKKEQIQKSLSKAEIAEMAGVSRRTMTRWMERMSSEIPDYVPSQRLLTPKQTAVVLERLCLTE